MATPTRTTLTSPSSRTWASSTLDSSPYCSAGGADKADLCVFIFAFFYEPGRKRPLPVSAPVPSVATTADGSPLQTCALHVASTAIASLPRARMFRISQPAQLSKCRTLSVGRRLKFPRYGLDLHHRGRSECGVATGGYEEEGDRSLGNRARGTAADRGRGGKSCKACQKRHHGAWPACSSPNR